MDYLLKAIIRRRLKVVVFCQKKDDRQRSILFLEVASLEP
jgi:hypothetical protein